MHKIDRRKLMVSGAIGAAALTVAAVPAVATVGADAELKRLWEEWKAQYACWLEQVQVFPIPGGIPKSGEQCESSVP